MANVRVRIVRIAAIATIAATTAAVAIGGPVASPAGADVLAPGALARRVEAAYARIAATDPTRHAWLALDAAGARVAADALDAVLPDAATGDVATRAWRPLDGLLVAVKDNLDTAGVATTGGSERLAKRVPKADATAVARVRSAGGIILGKTNLDTFARGVRTSSEVGGATGNAWDPSRSPGGSSGGSAVAVATGAVDVALGSDTCGSLRYPAAYNGVYGLRPTPGLVSRVGLMPLAPTQDVVGPLARTVDDLAGVLDAIAGPDADDPLTLSATRPASTYSAALDHPTDTPPPTIGVVRSMGRFAAAADGRTALDVLGESGAVLRPVTLPALRAASVIEDEHPAVRAQFLAAPEARIGRWLAGPINVRDDDDYQVRLRNRQIDRVRLVDLMDDLELDAIVYPTTPFPAARRGAPQPSGNCGLAATSGLPALALPHRLGVDGIPAVGVDLLGRPFDETQLLRIARGYERVAGITFVLPPLPR